MDLSELERALVVWEQTAKELLRCLIEDAKIAENMRDYWKNKGVND